MSFSLTHFRFNQKVITHILAIRIHNTASLLYQLSILNLLWNFWSSNFLLVGGRWSVHLVGDCLAGGRLVGGFKENHFYAILRIKGNIKTSAAFCMEVLKIYNR